VWLRVVGRPAEGVDALLEHFAVRRLRGACYPGLLPKPGARTRGILYRGLSEQDIGRLERYEGRWYERRLLPVCLASGDREMAWCFVTRKPCRRRLSPEAWSAEHFVRTHLKTYLKTC
jgi:hypothetical protein